MDIQCVCKYVGKRRNIYFLIRRRTDTQTHISIHIVGIGSYTKTSTKTGHENMRNQKLTRDCRRARYAQGSPKAGPRATFGQKNLEQPPYICICIYIYIYIHTHNMGIQFQSQYIPMKSPWQSRRQQHCWRVQIAVVRVNGQDLTAGGGMVGQVLGQMDPPHCNYNVRIVAVALIVPATCTNYNK